MKRLLKCLVVALAVTGALSAQGLSDKLRDGKKEWEGLLEKGNGAPVRLATEAILSKEGLTVSKADYNEMRVVVALHDYAARAQALEGDWPGTVSHLQSATATASENLTTAEATFARIRREHEAKLVEWRETVKKQEENLKKLEEQPGLTEGQIKYRAQLRSFLEEHRAAIAHSEWSLKEMEGILAQLKKEKETYKTSLESWQGFLDKEKSEVALAGSPGAYVGEKLEQVKGDESRPLFDRLSYARRLHKLDPGNRNTQAFIKQLQGNKGEMSEQPSVVKKKSRRSRKR